MLGIQPQMPLPDEPGAVPRVAEDLADGPLLGPQMPSGLRRDHFLPRHRRLVEQRLVIRDRREVASRDGDAQPGGIQPGHDAGAGGRAERAGGVGIGEEHASGGQAVDVRRLVVTAAEGAAVHPAQIVDQEEDHVGPARGLPAGQERRRQGRGGGGAEERAARWLPTNARIGHRIAPAERFAADRGQPCRAPRRSAMRG